MTLIVGCLFDFGVCLNMILFFYLLFFFVLLPFSTRHTIVSFGRFSGVLHDDVYVRWPTNVTDRVRRACPWSNRDGRLWSAVVELRPLLARVPDLHVERGLRRLACRGGSLLGCFGEAACFSPRVNLKSFVHACFGFFFLKHTHGCRYLVDCAVVLACTYVRRCLPWSPRIRGWLGQWCATSCLTIDTKMISFELDRSIFWHFFLCEDHGLFRECGQKPETASFVDSGKSKARCKIEHVTARRQLDTLGPNEPLQGGRCLSLLASPGGRF